MEFGTRRAQEMRAIWGTRAAVIGGATELSNVRAGEAAHENEGSISR